MKKNISLLVIVILVAACGKAENIDSPYVTKVKAHRAEKDSIMQYSPTSPFNAKGEVPFHKLKYFSVDSNFVFESKLTEYAEKSKLKIYGTKGEIRKATRFGYLALKAEKEIKLNVYQIATTDSNFYYAVWFTDKTTGKETYGVGRYLDFEYDENPEFIYTIDFNLAYSPWCSYSQNYSCAVPTKEDYLDLTIKVGEKNFH